jgi:hypothetical protein
MMEFKSLSAIRHTPPVPDLDARHVLVLNRPVQLCYLLNLFQLSQPHLVQQDVKSQIPISYLLKLHLGLHHLPEVPSRQSRAIQPLERYMLLKEPILLLPHPISRLSLLPRRLWRISGIRHNVA